MTPAHQQAIDCDAPGCLAEIEYTALAADAEEQAHIMRLVALKSGWRLGHGDYCPNHTDEAPCADVSECHPVLRDVLAERHRQDATWGEQNHKDGTGPLVKIAGHPSIKHREHARATCENKRKTGGCSWTDILTEEFWEAICEDDPVKLRAELIQVAAVAVAWAEAIDRRAQRSEARDAS